MLTSKVKLLIFKGMQIRTWQLRVIIFVWDTEKFLFEIQIFSHMYQFYRDYLMFARARSLVVSDLRSEIKDSRFEPGCQLCAEVSPLQQSPGQCLSAREAGGSGREELNSYPLPSLAVLWIVNVRERKPR